MNGYPEYASATAYLKRAGELMNSLSPACERLVDALYDAFEAGQTIFLAGNGGSAAAASHFGQDLAQGTLTSRHAERRKAPARRRARPPRARPSRRALP